MLCLRDERPRTFWRPPYWNSAGKYCERVWKKTLPDSHCFTREIMSVDLDLYVEPPFMNPALFLTCFGPWLWQKLWLTLLPLQIYDTVAKRNHLWPQRLYFSSGFQRIQFITVRSRDQWLRCYLTHQSWPGYLLDGILCPPTLNFSSPGAELLFPQLAFLIYSNHFGYLTFSVSSHLPFTFLASWLAPLPTPFT